jgi:hypothetical protein
LNYLFNGETTFSQFAERNFLIRKDAKYLAKHLDIFEDVEDEDSIEMTHLSPKNLTQQNMCKVFRRQMHHFNGIFIFQIFGNFKVFCKAFHVLSYKDFFQQIVKMLALHFQNHDLIN